MVHTINTAFIRLQILSYLNPPPHHPPSVYCSAKPRYSRPNKGGTIQSQEIQWQICRRKLCISTLARLPAENYIFHYMFIIVLEIYYLFHAHLSDFFYTYPPPPPQRMVEVSPLTTYVSSKHILLSVFT